MIHVKDYDPNDPASRGFLVIEMRPRVVIGGRDAKIQRIMIQMIQLLAGHLHDFRPGHTIVSLVGMGGRHLIYFSHAVGLLSNLLPF